MSTRTTCVRITRRDGVSLGLTELDKDLTVDGQLYKSAAGYTPTAFSAGHDLSVANADLEGVLGVLGVTRDDIRAGLYDGARVDVLVVDYLARSILWTLAAGFWGEATLTDGAYTAEFRSLSQRLQSPVGRLYQPACDAHLFDTRCGLDRTAYELTGTVTAIADRGTSLTISLSGGGTIPASYAGGSLEVVSGAAAGEVAEVRSVLASGSGVRLFLATIRGVAPGDAVRLYPGCAKSREACAAYSNIANYRGFPDVPGREALTQIGGLE